MKKLHCKKKITYINFIFCRTQHYYYVMHTKSHGIRTIFYINKVRAAQAMIHNMVQA